MIRRTLACVVAALGLALTTASPVSAAELENEPTVRSTLSTMKCAAWHHIAGLGGACFQSDGDWFELYDWGDDGLRVAVQWRLTDGSRRGLIRHVQSSGVAGMRNKNFYENKTLEMRLGTCRPTASNSCVALSTYNWRTGWDSGSTG
jgi:hypothetical protein